MQNQEKEKFGALIFDVDGVIADTEKDGHRVAFNEVFTEEGLGVIWDVVTYGELLKIAGGKERMRTVVYSPDFKKDVADKDEYIAYLHKKKTDRFMEIIASGKLQIRSGISRIIREAHDEGIKLAVASTSNERSVNLLLKTLLGEQLYGWFDVILAGDIVKQKKPSPEIYELSSSRLNVPGNRCAVIEDSRNGLESAKGAGMVCIVTPSEYTRSEDFAEADLVVSELGDPGIPAIKVISSAVSVPKIDFVTISDIRRLF